MHQDFIKAFFNKQKPATPLSADSLALANAARPFVL